MFEIDKFIEHLVGTCKSLDEAKSDFDLDRELTDRELEAIDEALFRCGGCDWWFPVEEMTEQEVCEGCEEAQGETNDEDE
jgi:hypothetical protein